MCNIIIDKKEASRYQTGGFATNNRPNKEPTEDNLRGLKPLAAVVNSYFYMRIKKPLPEIAERVEALRRR